MHRNACNAWPHFAVALAVYEAGRPGFWKGLTGFKTGWLVLEWVDPVPKRVSGWESGRNIHQNTASFYVHTKQINVDLYFSTAVTVSWAEDFYCFNESVGDALTMLQTNSSFRASIALTASPQEVVDNVTEVKFESNGQPMMSSIQFVYYNGIQYGVGSIGEWWII